MKANSTYVGDFWLGIIIPVLSLLGLYLGFYWWKNKSVPMWLGKIGIAIAIVGILTGIYYSLAWIPKALKGMSDDDDNDN